MRGPLSGDARPPIRDLFLQHQAWTYRRLIAKQLHD
jgi:hypothetical protein